MTVRVYGVVLAAGASSRLGHPKQLIEWQGKPLVLDIAGKLQTAGIDRIAVVVGAEEAGVRAILAGMDLDLIPNPGWREGMGGSIAAGVAHAEKRGAEAVLIALTDQPRIDAGHYRGLLEKYAVTHRIVATGYPDGSGVPAIFPRAHFEDLQKLEGDRGAREILARRSDVVEIVPNAAAADDIDLPSDL